MHFVIMISKIRMRVSFDYEYYDDVNAAAAVVSSLDAYEFDNEDEE